MDDTQVVEIGVAEELDAAHPIAMKAISGGVDEENFRVQRKTFAGTHSDSQLSNGTIRLAVSGTSDVGRPGEPAALDTLLNVLRDQGCSPNELTAEDNRGEDAVIELAGVAFTVQMVTVPQDSYFWQSAAKGHADAEAAISEAIDWIRACIVKKAELTSDAERPQTILVLDAHHAGVLSSSQISARYLSEYPEPMLEFGFASTWLIGPDSSCTSQLGATCWDK